MMEVCSLASFPKETVPISLALGNFDGLHLGHQTLLEVTRTQAANQTGHAWVLTFDPHPLQLIHPAKAPKLLTTRTQQKRLLDELNMAGLVIEPFTPHVMQLSPEEFFHALLKAIPSLQSICVGEDWSFGRNRAGNIDLLNTLCKQHHIHFHALPAVRWQGERISSTRIRHDLHAGNLDEVTAMLNRPYSVEGHVVHGEKIGRELGYPTANIAPTNEILPKQGVYAATLRAQGNTYAAAAYIGVKETLHQTHPVSLEAHVLNQQNIDLYDQHVELDFNAFIRENIKFENREALQAQIACDLDAIHHALAQDV